jgi:hypothetical protein
VLRDLCAYTIDCLSRALKGSLSGALNWAGIIGVGVVGGFLDQRGLPMSDPHTWQEIVKWTCIYTAVAWTVIFLVRLGVVSSFQIYRGQKRSIETTAVAPPKPKLNCSFNISDAGCFRPNTTLNFVLRDDGVVDQKNTIIKIPCNWYRIKVVASGGTFIGCRGRIISIKRGEAQVFSGEIAILPFAPSEKEDAISKSIYEGAPEYLDLFALTENSKVTLALHKFIGSNSVNWTDMFSLAGDYRFEILVISAESVAASTSLLFRWTLNPATSEIICPAA